MKGKNVKPTPEDLQAKGKKTDVVETDQFTHIVTKSDRHEVPFKLTPLAPMAIDWIPIGVKFTDMAGATIIRISQGQTCRCVVTIGSTPISGQPHTSATDINLTWSGSASMPPAVLMNPVTTPQSVLTNSTQLIFDVSLRTFTGGPAVLAVRATTNTSTGTVGLSASLTIV